MAEIDSLVKVHATVFYPEVTGQNTVSHNMFAKSTTIFEYRDFLSHMAWAIWNPSFPSGSCLT